MKAGTFIIITFGVVIIGYMFYLFVGMSSTYPPIKDYKFDISITAFPQELADRIDGSSGWSFKKGDSVKVKDKEDCYWVSLFYEADKQDLEYILKYCFEKEVEREW